MKTDDTLCDVLRHLFTWPDRVLVRDWSSAVVSMHTPEQTDALSELVQRYVGLRREAPNWSPKRYDRNNHSGIDREAVVTLLLEANRIDGDAGPPKKTKRTGRPRVRCVVCRQRFVADRSTARYCSEACKQRAKRARESGSEGPRSAERRAGVPECPDTLRAETRPSDSPISQEAP